MDVGDNIGGGSSADSTYILEEAQRMGVPSLSCRACTIPTRCGDASRWVSGAK